MHESSPDMPKATLILQDSGRPLAVLSRQSNGRTSTIMAHGTFGNTALTPETALRTAREWGEQAASLTKAAQACLAAADFLGDAASHLLATADPTQEQQAPEGVVLLAAYRARRQAVAR